jgi:hypothetical protein
MTARTFAVVRIATSVKHARNAEALPRQTLQHQIAFRVVARIRSRPGAIERRLLRRFVAVDDRRQEALRQALIFPALSTVDLLL